MHNIWDRIAKGCFIISEMVVTVRVAEAYGIYNTIILQMLHHPENLIVLWHEKLV